MNVKRKATASFSATAATPSAPKKLKQGSLTAFFGPPSGSKNTQTSLKRRFDKAAWIDGLTPPQRDLLRYASIITWDFLTCRLEINYLHESWLAALKDELTKPYFLKVPVFHESQSLLKFAS